MIDWHTPLGHHFFEVAVAHAVAAVPPHRPQDDVTGEVTTGEDAHGRDYFTSIFLLPQLCNSTRPTNGVSVTCLGIRLRPMTSIWACGVSAGNALSHDSTSNPARAPS